MRSIRWLLAFFVLMVGSAASARTPQPTYDQPDGGYLVYAVGTIPDGFGMDYSFFYRRIVAATTPPLTDWQGIIEPQLGGMIYLKVKNPDFTGRETGHVRVRRLPPGTYVVDGFFFGGSMPGVGTFEWSASRPFKLEFTIKEGEATYIGSFMRAVSLGTSLEPQLNAAGFFVIADRSERDLTLARAKLPAGIAITTQVTNVDTLDSLVLRSSEPK